MSSSRTDLPNPLVVAASLAGLEGVVLVFLGVAEVASLSSERVAMGVTTAVFFAVFGLALAWCAWQVTRLNSWARSPIVLAQLIQLGVAWSFRGAPYTVLAIFLAVTALVTIGGLLHPASIDALADDS